MEAAIDTARALYPPLTSDSWPMCRPLVEWMLRKLPAGGAAPERKEWSDEETAAIAADFFASRFGAPLDREDERALLESVLWFGTDYTTGDPFRWSPVTVELLLVDWFPRKVVAEPAYLAKMPDLRPWLHPLLPRPQGIRAALTAETLDCGRPLGTAVPAGHPLGPAAGPVGAAGADVRGADGADDDDLSTRTRSCWKASTARSAVGSS